MIIEPLAAMAAACIAISNGEANEIELTWARPISDDRDESLSIVVRREVRHFTIRGDSE